MREFLAALVLSWFVADATMLLTPLPRAQADQPVKLQEASACVPPKDQARHASGTGLLMPVHTVRSEPTVASEAAPAQNAADTRKKRRKQ